MGAFVDNLYRRPRDLAKSRRLQDNLREFNSALTGNLKFQN